ncbi:MAG: DUF4954 family protein [Spirochaetaceae bacterium]|jgi:hypothetical protein|nr:DUF4954 family protein [Spirochaetaceae bacterium]
MADQWRLLTDQEIGILKVQGNTNENWQTIEISGEIDLQGIKNCTFQGILKLKNISYVILEKEGRRYYSGLYNSTIEDCQIEGNAAVIDLGYLRGYRVQTEVLLSRIDEMIHIPGSAFGQGMEIYNKLKIANESGSRGIYPFIEMNSLDARLWSLLRGHKKILERFSTWTKNITNKGPGEFALIAKNTSIKNSNTIKKKRSLGSDRA